MKSLLHLTGLLFSLLIMSGCGASYPSSVAPGIYSTTTGLGFSQERFYPEINSNSFPEDQIINKKSVKVVEAQQLTKEKKEELRTAQAAAMQQILVDTADLVSVNYAPGGVYIHPLQLYADETEVANIHWQEYLTYLNQDSTVAFYQSQQPDTTVIQLNKTDYYRTAAGQVVSAYQYHPEYQFYPVVGISYEQAADYCKWRSNVVTELVKSDPNNKEKVQVIYRLPTEKEWEIIAAAGYDKNTYPYSSATGAIRKYKLNPVAADFLSRKITAQVPAEQVKKDIVKEEVQDNMFNVRRTLPYFLQVNTPDYIYSGTPNDYGLLHVQGNVAEMVAEKGIAKGGSWKDKLEDSKITDRQLYSSPSDKVGFRCVCEIKPMEK
ncbi:formylglycine-generating enzyme family protein [Pontibacter cellulosilyticus]|uniref:SUMF1/EgtB/PvdO family nonheme iron enzyme n=1 Tax=Pontibacter cellulosilyticus TaxID=1720253 RepID=A0A923N8N3_9BACT|nr:SUMF1/EgtB/PvdO family nonheme iron enzyme [Pontibacter cellulosilyticus]MBC5994234.1 SUMF1/EgtB/PvdO family nonheme iron enzyme [Pontibacter cellulosilyticus]